MPRITLIHGIQMAQQPAWDAFARGWPEAQVFNLLDDSLSADLFTEGTLTSSLSDRIVSLAHYAAGAGAGGHLTDGIVFTCSPFGPAIRKARAELSIPVLLATEAALDLALEAGPRVGLVAASNDFILPHAADLKDLARQSGKPIEVTHVVPPGSLELLKVGKQEEYYRCVADAASAVKDVDTLLFLQFSMAPAASLVPHVEGRRVLTTPGAAVERIKNILKRKPALA